MPERLSEMSRKQGIHHFANALYKHIWYSVPKHLPIAIAVMMMAMPCCNFVRVHSIGITFSTSANAMDKQPIYTPKNNPMTAKNTTPNGICGSYINNRFPAVPPSMITVSIGYVREANPKRSVTRGITPRMVINAKTPLATANPAASPINANTIVTGSHFLPVKHPQRSLYSSPLHNCAFQYELASDPLSLLKR